MTDKDLSGEALGETASRGNAVRTRLIDALLAGDTGTALALLDAAAIFHSPVRSYQGIETIRPLWTTIGEILQGAQPSGVLVGRDQAAAFFDAVAGTESVDGVLRVRGSDRSPAAEVTLMLRPYQALKAAIGEMSRRLTAGGAVG